MCSNEEELLNMSCRLNSYESIESNKECMFVIRTLDGKNEHRKLLNTENDSIRDIDYDYIHFHSSLPYRLWRKSFNRKK